MASKVNQSPNLPSPISSADTNYLLGLVRAIITEFQYHANTINDLVTGSNTPLLPVIMPTYLKTALPSAATYINGMIIVSNDVGGLTPAFSDGTNWRRVADRNVIS